MSATIEINMDKRCRKCGKPGAMQIGVCLKCFTKMVPDLIKKMRADEEASSKERGE